MCVFIYPWFPVCSARTGHGFPERSAVRDAAPASVLPLPRCLLWARLHPLRPQLLLHLHHLAMGRRPSRQLSQMSDRLWDSSGALRKFLCQGDVGADPREAAGWRGIACRKDHLLWRVHSKTNKGREIVPRVSHLVLSQSPGATPQGCNAEDSQADWTGGNYGGADL